RARPAGCREAQRRRAAGHQPEVERGARGPRAGDPVAAELRHRRQDLLRLHRPRRGHHLRARPLRRLPGEQRLAGLPGDRPRHRRVAPPFAAVLASTTPPMAGWLTPEARSDSSASRVPVELQPPELARLVDYAERPRRDDWSLRAALVRYAQPEPQRVSAILDLVRRIEWALRPHQKLLDR